MWALPYAKGTHGFVRQVFDGWELAPIITARTGQPFTGFDCTNNIGDTVCARYFLTNGLKLSTTGNSNNVPQLTAGGQALPNTFVYTTLPISTAYADPLVGSGELPTCNMVTNGAGNLVSTGQNCHWPANMLHRNFFKGPGYYNINLAIRKAFPITERYSLQFSSEFYNMLNHSNYYVQSGSPLDVSSGDPTLPFQVIGKRGVNPAGGVANERRFIQFALKLKF